LDLTQLNEHFAIPGILSFHETASGLAYASVTAPNATATVYLQGAHLSAWQPNGQKPVLFLSRKSDLLPGKPIRGGVPIAFPWFANRHDGKPGPSHGFARIQEWTLVFAAMAGDDLHLTFTFAPTEMSRTFGFDNFRLAYQLTIGRTLTMQLTVANDASTPLVFEEALHTYYAITDIHEITVTGLDGVTYLDKVDNFKPKVQQGAITITEQTDRVYLSTTGPCIIHDTPGKRRIHVEKTGSSTTVIWNPWENGAQKIADLDPTEWHEFVALETVNAAANTITIAPKGTHVMQAHVTVEDIAG